MVNMLNIPKEERPIEKMIRHGAFYLTETELLSIIIRTGSKNRNVLELSREILLKYELGIISRKTYRELLSFKGISKVKASQIISVFELARRLSNRIEEEKIKILNSYSLFDYVQSDFYDSPTEKIMIVMVDTKNQVIRKEFISYGEIDYSVLDIRNLLKNIFTYDASGFFLIHNHPSGDLRPSRDDIEMTKKIKSACDMLNVRFLDHIIVSNTSYKSIIDMDI